MSDLGEILDAIDVEAYLDAHGVDYIRTRGRSGPQLNLHVCPVCGNDGKKVYLNAETGLGTCFAGSHPPGETFDKWKLAKALNPELSGRQLFEHLSAFVADRGWVAKREKSVETMTPPALILPESFELPYEGRNLKYLTNRGITSEIAKYFHLRFCADGGFAYEHEGKIKIQKYSQRVIIPVFDLDGKMVTFQGRDVSGTAEKKYLFPPGLAATGSQLLNGMNARDTDEIIIGEGAFDIMAIKLALDEDQSLRHVVPVGTFGKSLSYGPGDTQLTKLLELRNRGIRRLVFMWDGEIAATDAAVRAGFMCQGLGFDVRIAMLPADRDPNEVSGAVVRETYRTAVPLTRVSAVRILMQRRKENKQCSALF